MVKTDLTSNKLVNTIVYSVTVMVGDVESMWFTVSCVILAILIINSSAPGT